MNYVNLSPNDLSANEIIAKFDNQLRKKITIFVDIYFVKKISKFFTKKNIAKFFNWSYTKT